MALIFSEGISLLVLGSLSGAKEEDTNDYNCCLVEDEEDLNP